MKKIIIIIFIFSSLLFAEDNYEVADSTKEINIQKIENKLLDEIKENEKKLEKQQTGLQILSEKLSEQQAKIIEINKKLISDREANLKLNKRNNAEIKALNTQIESYYKDLKSLEKETYNNLTILRDSLEITSIKLSESSSETERKLVDIDNNISRKTLYIIIGSLILLLFIVIVFFVLKFSIKNKTKNLDDIIMETRKKMEVETVKLDAKLVEILEKQIKLTERKPTVKDEEIDHSIFIKVANEIQRMRRRITNMPDDTKGIGALKNALRRLEEGLNDNEYELIDLTGKEYVDGLTTRARFVESGDIPKGQQLITKTIKLQVDYKGVIIQPSEIEVSIGE